MEESRKIEEIKEDQNDQVNKNKPICIVKPYRYNPFTKRGKFRK